MAGAVTESERKHRDDQHRERRRSNRQRSGRCGEACEDVGADEDAPPSQADGRRGEDGGTERRSDGRGGGRDSGESRRAGQVLGRKSRDRDSGDEAGTGEPYTAEEDGGQFLAGTGDSLGHRASLGVDGGQGSPQGGKRRLRPHPVTFAVGMESIR